MTTLLSGQSAPLNHRSSACAAGYLATPMCPHVSSVRFAASADYFATDESGQSLTVGIPHAMSGSDHHGQSRNAVGTARNLPI
jgi:hypothetical protein